MGHPGNAGHPDVQKAIFDGIAVVRRAGKAAGIITTQREAAQSLPEGGRALCGGWR